MGMNVGGGGGLKSEINVTPLVDVVLVLLIIFMVVTPMLQMGYDVKVPPKAEESATTVTTAVASTDQIILRLSADGKIFINKEEVPPKDFTFRFQQAIQGQESKVIFLAADGEAVYEDVMIFLDQCRDIGAQNIGIVLDEMSGAAADATDVAPPAGG